jgi:hypothetical protein
MSYKIVDAGILIAILGAKWQLFELPRLVLIFVMCIYIEIRNKFDRNNELLF